MEQTKWGILSAGMISNDFVNAIYSLDDAKSHEVVAVAARSLHKAKEFASKFDIPKAYGNYEDLGRDPNISVIYVGSICQTHLEVCKMLLNYNKHILCEKPLAMNIEETEEILKIAKEKKVFFMEAIWSRTIPMYLKLKEELKSGSIGKVFSLNTDFGFKVEGFFAERIANKIFDINDIMIYCVQVSQLVFDGDFPIKIIAAGHTNAEGVEESISATLLYSGGRTASFQSSLMVNGTLESNIYGSEGNMKLLSPFWCGTKLQLKDGNVLDFGPLPDRKKADYFYFNSANLGFEAQHVRECIQKGLTESPLLTHEETLNIAKIVQEVRTLAGRNYK